MGRTLHQLQSNFTSGELDPKLAAREDTKLYFNGMRRLRNMVVQPQGGARRRPGLEFIALADSNVGDALYDSLAPSPSGAGFANTTYTYPEGRTGSHMYEPFESGGDTSIATTTDTLSSATPFVVVRVEITGGNQQVRCVDVHNLYISTGASATFKVQHSPDAVTWTDFAGGETIVAGTVTRAQYRRITSTNAVGHDNVKYWRLICSAYDASAASALASVGTFRLNLRRGHSTEFTPLQYRLIPFEFNDEQIYMILASHENYAIYKNGALLRNVMSPYGANRTRQSYTLGATELGNYQSIIPAMNWTQSADTLITVNRYLQPCRLVRSVDEAGNTSEQNWVTQLLAFSYLPKFNFTLTQTSPATTLTPNKIEGGVTLTAGSGVFTAAMLDDLLFGNGGIVRLTQFVSTTVMKGVTLVPFYDTTAIASGSWYIAGDYVDAWSASIVGGQLVGWPRSVTFHEGRLVFGGSRLRPHTVWGSRVDDFFSMDPGQGFDDDAFEFTLDTDQVNAINNVISGRDLQIFTLGGEFYIPQTAGEPITPATAFAKRQTSRGSKSGLRVIDVDGGTMFVQREGTAIREYLFADLEQSYNANNISLLSSHLINDPQDFCLRPATDTDEGDLIIVVNADGTIATCSTLRNQEVTAWTLQETLNENGTTAQAKACGALKYGQNETYFVVSRDFTGGGGETIAYLERWNENHRLDCSKKVVVSSGSATGLTHFIGAGSTTVVQAIVENADGTLTYLGNVTVSSVGTVTGLSAYNGLTVEFGFAFFCEGETMPAAPALQEGTARSRLKRIVEATFLLRESGSLTVQGDVLDFGGVVDFEGQKVAEGLMDYTEDGTMSFGQDKPFPLQILGVAVQVSV
jgi:hypothetical protein